MEISVGGEDLITGSPEKGPNPICYIKMLEQFLECLLANDTGGFTMKYVIPSCLKVIGSFYQVYSI